MLHIESFQMNIFWYSARKTATTRANWVLHVSIVEGEVVRSEEHTSELQSHVRISYAVFCLKKKKKKKKQQKKQQQKQQQQNTNT